MEILCQSEQMMVDGTFKTRPIMFSQVYVIMGKYLGDGMFTFLNAFIKAILHLYFSARLVIPLVWCLTPKKTQKVYEKLFKIIQKLADDQGCQLKPQQVYLDFEHGAINALEKTVSVISKVKTSEYHLTFFENARTRIPSLNCRCPMLL